MAQGLACLDSGATFVFFAVPPPGQDLPMPMHELWRREVVIRTAYGAAPSDLSMALELIASGRVAVTDLITHRLPLDDIGAGFRMVVDGTSSVKVLIEP